MRLKNCGEIYRWIEGFENLYMVSNYGRVFNQKYRRFVGARSGKGHIIVALCDASRSLQIRKYVHVLVLETFVGPRPIRFEACHNNGDPADNRVWNLRWDTAKANQQDKVRHNTLYYGERHKASKVSEVEVRSLRKEYASGDFTQEKLAEKYNISRQQVSRIIGRYSWKHVF